MAPAAEVGDRVPVDLTQMVADHHAVLYRYAYRLTGTVADAEDLTQQTFLAAQANLGQLRDGSAARSWLFQILRNCFLKQQRQRRPRPAADLELDVEAIADDLPVDEPLDEERLQAALNDLPEVFRAVVMQFYFEGRSYREIAAQLELPIGTVMSRLARAKAQLRKRLFEPVGHLADRGHGRPPRAS